MEERTQMVNCPLCDAAIDVDEEELDEGDVLTCEECGTNLTVNSVTPLDLVSEDDDEADDDDDDDFDDDYADDEEDEDEEDEDPDEDSDGGKSAPPRRAGLSRRHARGRRRSRGIGPAVQRK